MNNNLSENLKKIRKDNNLSQEQLAEKLGVSRQAISKWESGTAYPEMEKIIQLCDKFDMNIDDLLHRDICEIKGEQTSKNNLNKFIDSFLNYITDTINLFSRMNFKSKIKCLFEQIVIATILLIIAVIVGSLCGQIVYGLYHILPTKLYYFIREILSSIYIIFAFIVCLGILSHIFKTRYLDYYSKIKKEYQKTEGINEDSKPKENESKESKRSNEKSRILFKQNENKIIIRDPKHSEYRFINGIFKIIILGIKFFTLIGLFFCCLTLIGLFACLVMSLALAKTGVFFAGLILMFISSSITCIVLVLILLNFISNRKNDKKKMIWSFIISIIGLGISCGMLFLGSLNFDFIDKRANNNEYLETRTLEIDMKNNLFFNEYYDIEYIEKDIDTVQVEYTINKLCEVNYNLYDRHGVYLHSYCENPLDLSREFIKNLNDKKIIDMNCDLTILKIYASKNNIEKMKTNYNNYIQHEENFEDQLNEYAKQINQYEKKMEIYENKISDYEEQIYSLKEELEEYKIDN